jgi:wyosine [tRNA(Phe)-imidazoG37] synthetase (radical SAM superfamily)
MFVYGPIPSRRLGRSLGVSPIPHKTCSFSCVYCQLGRSCRLQTKRERFFLKEEILGEIVAQTSNSRPDYITFTGDGEPSLCLDLGWLIRESKRQTNLPVAVMTNGSLLFRKDVRQDLEPTDIVMPSLDAGCGRTMKEINRAHQSIDFSTVLQGMKKFRNEYRGQVWLEIMLVKGLNDSEGELWNIRRAAEEIRPDRIFVMTPVRPPAELWVEPPTAESLIAARTILGEVEIIDNAERGIFESNGFSNAKEALLQICSRHPLARDQASDIENAFPRHGPVIEKMLDESKLVEVEYRGIKYLLVGQTVRGAQLSGRDPSQG